MSTKNIAIWVVVILVVAVGAYFIFKGGGAPTEDAAAQAAAAAAATGEVASTDQVQGQDVTVGTGPAAEPGTVVSVLYVGKLQDGTVFDSSAAHGNEPLRFTLGQEGLIAGFQIGINGMKEGGERLLAIPPALGYAAQEIKDANGAVIIPPNSTLLFDVKLVKVEPAPPAPAGGAAN